MGPPFALLDLPFHRGHERASPSLYRPPPTFSVKMHSMYSDFFGISIKPGTVEMMLHFTLFVQNNLLLIPYPSLVLGLLMIGPAR